jgi:hypothetical protein
LRPVGGRSSVAADSNPLLRTVARVCVVGAHYGFGGGGVTSCRATSNCRGGLGVAVVAKRISNGMAAFYTVKRCVATLGASAAKRV